MKNYDMTSLRGLVEQMPTEQLDEMLRHELEKEPVDESAVRLIMDVLEEREQDTPVEINEQIVAAWERYQVQPPEQKRPRYSFGGWPVRVATAVVVISALVVAVPQNAEAEEFWGRLTRWTESVFEFFAPGETKQVGDEYVFETDNLGLQQVYDTVIALDITEPVVPMWLPEGYELVECKVNESYSKTSIRAFLKSGNSTAVLDIAIRKLESPQQYSKDETDVATHEIADVVHNILHNNDRWTATWVKDRLECAIAIDCQEETLYKILKSIYTMEDD